MSVRERAGGILLHVTSLPGRFGVGELGPAAEAWVEWLAKAGCRLWQMLPLSPTGYGDSPYQALSAFAGNPLLVSVERLLEDGLLKDSDLEPLPPFPSDRVVYGDVIPFKRKLLQVAAARLTASPAGMREPFDAFCEQESAWLDEFALFMALKDLHRGAPWSRWESGLASRDPDALGRARRDLADEIEAHRVVQYLFFRDWRALRRRVEALGLTLIGDVPIFVAHDSADVWAHPELFDLDNQGEPTAVAGVPPDYFSPTGQRWGNPLYRWDVMAQDGYAWWIARLRAILSQVDVVRLDHFRGFEAFWRIPASAPTAETGEWVAGPGAKLLGALHASLGSLPLIAEDLGVITPEVRALRDQFALPGMKVLQFAFEGDKEFLPHNYIPGCIVYTGTHDNDTAVGWYEAVAPEARDFCRRYLARDGSDIAWDLIRAAWSSVAEWAITPMQDLLTLGSAARMNFPSRPEGNWAWRVAADQLTDALAGRMSDMNEVYGRSARATETRAD